MLSAQRDGWLNRTRFNNVNELNMTWRAISVSGPSPPTPLSLPSSSPIKNVRTPKKKNVAEISLPHMEIRRKTDGYIVRMIIVWYIRSCMLYLMAETNSSSKNTLYVVSVSTKNNRSSIILLCISEHICEKGPYGAKNELKYKHLKSKHAV